MELHFQHGVFASSAGNKSDLFPPKSALKVQSMTSLLASIFIMLCLKRCLKRKSRALYNHSWKAILLAFFQCVSFLPLITKVQWGHSVYVCKENHWIGSVGPDLSSNNVYINQQECILKHLFEQGRIYFMQNHLLISVYIVMMNM